MTNADEPAIVTTTVTRKGPVMDNINLNTLANIVTAVCAVILTFKIL